MICWMTDEAVELEDLEEARWVPFTAVPILTTVALPCPSTPQGELLVTILAGFATFERHLIKARTDDGRKRAKACGVRFGRRRKLDQHQRQEALQRLANGETLVDVASGAGGRGGGGGLGLGLGGSAVLTAN
jgi:hypothetical protein